MRLLTNQGLGDLRDPRVIDQLRAKHPQRKEPMEELARMLATFHGSRCGYVTRCAGWTRKLALASAVFATPF
jgi:hypothetical protein